MGGRRMLLARSAQSSMEYLIIAAFALLILSVIMIVAYSRSSSFSSDVGRAQIERVGSTIVDASNTVYYAGPPTKKTIKLFFPQNIRDVVGPNGTTDITFLLQGDNGMYPYTVTAATNLTGTIKSVPGMHVITFTAGQSSVNVSDR